ncbi:hypothetical protein PDE_01939 [Penicillium oxalicum 114-2]|uniref:Uncharacterized protein n=1 Tax=Penicillium oxalicum (strain 114-2 / CGMCC 5302) TaxID=933388 RepID=S8AM99_PENO1|nr:hypothetical protein PDE_01939 [Penicillium oxalicum 114-2]
MNVISHTSSGAAKALHSRHSRLGQFYYGTAYKIILPLWHFAWRQLIKLNRKAAKLHEVDTRNFSFRKSTEDWGVGRRLQTPSPNNMHRRDPRLLP